jgi:hypothetical protein
MSVLPADYDGRTEARARETIVRLALSGQDNGDRLFGSIDRWLNRKATFLELVVQPDAGRHGAQSPRGVIELDRTADRLVALVAENDVNVPTRRWTTEIYAERSAVRIEVRVTVEQPLNAPYAPRQTPRFIADAITDPLIGIVDVVPLGVAPRPVGAADVTDLVALINDARRRLPVVVISTPTVVDPAQLGLRLAGAAHIITLDPEASFALTDAIGRYRSVFHGGVRTYPPGFRSIDSPQRAPLWLGARLAEVHDGLPADERIVRLVLARTTASVADRALPTIAELDRDARLEHEGVGAAVRADVADLQRDLAAAQAERDALAARLDDNEELLGLADYETKELREQRDDAEEAARIARNAEYRWRAALDAIQAANAGDALALEDGSVAPTEDAAFVAFVEDRYAGRILVSPRARRFYKDGEYEDREFLVRVLDAIATGYYDFARGVPGAHERWDAACERLRLKSGASCTPTGATEDHRLRWNGYAEIMYHVRSLGTTFDPRRMLYVGFIFDAAAQQVVLGRLPSKPPTMADHS